MPSSQYTDIKKTCSAARYPEQHRPGCYSHPLALPDQKLIRDVPRRPMKFPHATAAFRGSLPCWSSLARCARARAAAPPAVARAARHAAPHLAYAVVRHAAIHKPNPHRSLLALPRPESCNPKASLRRLSSPRSRTRRSSPRWSRSVAATCRSLRLTRRPPLPHPETALGAVTHRERSRYEREHKSRMDKKPTGEGRQGNKKEEKNKGNVKRKKENKKGNRLCIFRNCYSQIILFILLLDNNNRK
jgi:hypothetical protein